MSLELPTICNKPRFMDEDELSDEEIIIIPKTCTVQKRILSVIGKRDFVNYLLPDSKNYDFLTWKQCFPDNRVLLRKLLFNSAWNDFFDRIGKHHYYSSIERILSDMLMRDKIILPYAELVFNVFNIFILIIKYWPIAIRSIGIILNEIFAAVIQI